MDDALSRESAGSESIGIYGLEGRYTNHPIAPTLRTQEVKVLNRFYVFTIVNQMLQLSQPIWPTKSSA